MQHPTLLPPCDVRWSCRPARGRAGVLVRAGRLTPDLADAIVEDAVRAGAGARLELVVAAGVPADAIASLRTRLARRRITVPVHAAPAA